MTTDQLKNAVAARPFVPFTLKTTGGREYHIDHQELVSFSPGGRVVNVWVSADAGAWIDVLMIESIHTHQNGEGKRRRKAG